MLSLPTPDSSAGAGDGTAGPTWATMLNTAINGLDARGGFRFPISAWYGNPTLASIIDEAGDSTLVAGQIHAGWWLADETVNVTKIGTANGGGTTGALLRAGIYADSGHGKPGALVADAGTAAAVGASGSIVWSGLNLTLNPGLYWIAFVAQGSATTYGIKAWGIGGSNQRTWPATPGDTSWPEYFGSKGAPAWSSSATTYTGALPDPFPAAVGSTLQYGRSAYGSLWVEVP